MGVPGELRGLEEAYKRCGGGVSWERLFQPAAEIARESTVGLELGRRLTFAPFGKPLSSWMLSQPVWSNIFAPKGRLLKAGQTLRRPAYAKTLTTIGEKGAAAFYEGPIAEAMVKTVQAAGGILTLEDLKGYKVIVRPALEATYRDRKYYTTHAPSGGPVIISLLNTVEGYKNWVEKGRTGLAIHRFIEALKCELALRLVKTAQSADESSQRQSPSPLVPSWEILPSFTTMPNSRRLPRNRLPLLVRPLISLSLRISYADRYTTNSSSQYYRCRSSISLVNKGNLSLL